MEFLFMNEKFYVTDCEGPLSINDNAYEISDYFIPEGGEFFSILSNYDDILVERNAEGYLAGSTVGSLSVSSKLGTKSTVFLLISASISIDILDSLASVHRIAAGESPSTEPKFPWPSTIGYLIDHSWAMLTREP
jgi:hypothetical protein